MGDFIGSIYCWFEDFFGTDLANYMWGQLNPDHTHNQYIGIGWITLLVSLLVALAYYRFIDSPRWNHWWGWLIYGAGNALVALLLGWQWTHSDFVAGNMSYKLNEAGQKIGTDISEVNCLNFGISNLFISILFFCLLSAAFMWISNNCYKSPLRK